MTSRRPRAATARQTEDDDEAPGTALRGRGGSSRGGPPSRWLGRSGWLVLALSLTALALAAGTADRFGWSRPLGEEATYAMQAGSLAFDADLTYEPADLSRFTDGWRMEPRGLVLQRREGASRATFGRPFLYGLFLAPWVWLSPITGPQLANALWLALAALLAARALGRTLGPEAPWWVAALLFGTVAFGAVFRVEPGAFHLGAVAIAFALAWGGERTSGALPGDLYTPEGAEGGWRVALRWLAVGALLAVPAAWQPLYLILILPAALAVPKARRRAGLAALAAGAAGLLLAAAVVQVAAGGQWSAFDEPWATVEAAAGAERPASAGAESAPAPWPVGARERSGAHLPALAAVRAGLDRRLQGWNGVYLLAGRHTGLLPFFLPLLLPLAAAAGRRGRWALVPAALLVVTGLSVLRPFDLFGGADALPGAGFLPLLPAIWFLAGRPSPRPGRRVLAAVVLTTLAGAFLWPLWRAPAAFPFTADGSSRFAVDLARRLPVETTQRALPGERDLARGELRLRSLDGAVTADRAGPDGPDGSGLTLASGRGAHLLVASRRRLTGVLVEFERRAPAKIAVQGAETASSLFRPDGRVAFALRFGTPRATHPAWWSDGADVHFWELSFSLPGARQVPLAFTVEPGGWRG